MTMRLRLTALAGAGLALLAGVAAGAQAVRSGAVAGDPGRGAVLYVSAGCGACHVLRAAGSTGASGPDLDRWLDTHAARAGLAPADFALSRITFGGRGMPAAVGTLAPEEIEHLVAYVVGAPFTAPAGGVGQVPPLPAPPPLAVAAPKTLKAWIATRGLKGSARRGAAVFATAGCLSCHTYLGSGARRVGAPDLTRGGPSRASAARLRQLVGSPSSVGSTRMPAYADLGNADLRALADFLLASRR